MKFKLSKSKWEQIGNNTGWIKKSQEFAWLLSPEKSKILQKIFNALPGKLKKTNRITTDYKEIDFDDLAGQAYISMSFNSDKNSMHIEKYYESEFLQNEMGEVFSIPVNWNSPQETINKILTQINSWIENRKASNIKKLTKNACLTKNQLTSIIALWNSSLKNEKDLDKIRLIKETLYVLQEMNEVINQINSTTSNGDYSA